MMEEKIFVTVFIAIMLIIFSILGYYTNWLVHYTVDIYGWMPIILADAVILTLFIMIIFEE